MCPVATSARASPREQHSSSNLQCLVAYAPRGFGLLCALVYAMRDNDAYGWWIGPVDGVYQPAYFQLSNYFSAGERAFYATHGGDLYGGWTRDYDAQSPKLDEPAPVDDELAHRLERMQFLFAQEWLSFAGDNAAREEQERYSEAELAQQDVNVKFHRLNRLDKDQPVWTYRSPGFDVNILERLARDWPLEYRGAP
jgi:hypothetical protein